MSRVEQLEIKGVFKPTRHYSIATRIGRAVHVSGIVALDEEGQLVGEGSVDAQTTFVCQMLKQVCEQNEATLADVSQCLVIITDRQHYEKMDAAFGRVFGSHRPARATLIAGLIDERLLVEITGVIHVP